ncbi:MAG: YceI family protein [Alphaproteobacteria bacterium]|jgi:polyisoprenoid-binding protein YceI|nr:YceI family protein [Alphaproteobacteria bacterium]MCB1551321.1 YceI family protein [Alphaproteobacteria bacterium]MCB9984176.1 YceI family protein [Micavibrio sp.]HPQ50661.1 YceI family protein [Alphaproteobacteria bacterium]HRK97023.1 YceI family protein [Alphaproteobacteria bacterium]
MNTGFLLSTAVVALSFGGISQAQAATETYTFDPFHTNLFWKANHFGFSNPSGKFATVSGTVLLDESNPAASSVNVTINTASIVTGIDLFNEHLKADKFFNVEKFPTATFASHKVDITGSETAKVEGNLTLLGITKPVTLDVKLNKIGENPISNLKTAGFSATGIVKRSDFGITYALPGVSDDVEIAIEAEANIQPATNQ